MQQVQYIILLYIFKIEEHAYYENEQLNCLSYCHANFSSVISQSPNYPAHLQ